MEVVRAPSGKPPTQALACHRPVVLELLSGERIRGVLVHATPELYCVRFEETSLVIEEREVVRLQYEDLGPESGTPASSAVADEAPALEPDAPVAPPEPPVRIERAPLEQGPARIAAVREAIFGGGGGAPPPGAAKAASGGAPLRTYLLVDGASLPAQVLQYLEAKRAGHLCLYPGRLTREQRAVAPYLVPLEAGEKLDQRLVPTGWGQHWGVYLRAYAAPEQLVKHLRALLVVADERGERHHLRFFDPRVLETFLEGADAHEAATFFGGAWVRRRDGREDMLCPLCDADFPALKTVCASCEAPFWARSESVPFLVAEVVFEGEEGDVLVRARAAPDSFDGGRRPPMRRGPQRGRKVLNVRAEQWAALRAAYRRRRLERWIRAALQKAAADRWKTLGPPAARRAVREAIAAAAAHGIESGPDVARFAGAVFFDPELAGRDRPGASAPSEHAERLWREVEERARRAGFDPDAIEPK